MLLTMPTWLGMSKTVINVAEAAWPGQAGTGQPKQIKQPSRHSREKEQEKGERWSDGGGGLNKRETNAVSTSLLYTTPPPPQPPQRWPSG